MESAKKQTAQISGVSDIAFDLLTLLHNKLEGIAALEGFKADATGNAEVMSLIDDLQQTAVKDVERIKPMLLKLMG